MGKQGGTAYYYFDTCTTDKRPAHDPCGKYSDNGLKKKKSSWEYFCSLNTFARSNPNFPCMSSKLTVVHIVYIHVI